MGFLTVAQLLEPSFVSYTAQATGIPVQRLHAVREVFFHFPSAARVHPDTVVLDAHTRALVGAFVVKGGQVSDATVISAANLGNLLPQLRVVALVVPRADVERVVQVVKKHGLSRLSVLAY